MTRARKRFWYPLLTSKPASMTQSAQTIIYIIYSSWLGLQIPILKFTYSQDFQHKPIRRIFVQLSKKPSLFCPLEVSLK